MFEFLKRKRCPQCGEELRMFKKVAYCSLHCAAIAHSQEVLAHLHLTNDAVSVIHDAVYDLFGYEPNEFEIVQTYMLIPEDIHNEARQWEWSDTEVRGKVHEFLKGAVKGDR